MYSRFMNLDEEKRIRIINAAMKEFATHGFKGAKTDNIIKQAGISKGLLFHYFGTKKGLFDFILDYSMEICVNFLDEINMDEDILTRLRENTLIKIKLAKQSPDLFNFIITASERDEEDIQKETKERIEKFTELAYSKMFSGIDYSKFKEGIDIQQAMDVIMWTIEGFSNKSMVIYKEKMVEDVLNEELFTELDSYLNILRESLYK
ncbi:TetR/AcrR family transcriptional regulator [Alkalicella caledoniensis]|uniref:TetR/AcrR family transcriptional regulator n=1 Tax=Alkalicella caledoniensis TaxID=2731377 RepID=A0A7G9W9Y2_ALKCA|nr:TetR/AcrR family transcriptional regulator [Alkalicella caledoniensis]QNO15494.1 TetR/AcrR family transcriptional regulator [Alkalicella caledoniensis]